MLNISNDVKDIVLFFFVRLLSQNDDTRGGPPLLSDATELNANIVSELLLYNAYGPGVSNRQPGSPGPLTEA